MKEPKKCLRSGKENGMNDTLHHIAVDNVMQWIAIIVLFLSKRSKQ